MSSIENDEVRLELRPTDLRDVLDEVRTLFDPQMREKQLDFTVRRDQLRHAHVMCDGESLSRVLFNMVENAWKFTPSGGSVGVFLRETGASDDSADYEIRVTDTGIGMSAEFAEKVFNAFERERTSTDSGVQGKGLGLSIACSILQRMGGEVQVNSVRDQGSEFIICVSFPLCGEEAPAPAAPAEEEPADFTGRRVLLVEDNEINREIAVMILTEVGFSVDTGAEALAAVHDNAETLSLLLLDLNLPDMHGLDLLRQLKADAVLARLPVIVMTGELDSEVECLTLGAIDFIPKPYPQPKIVLARILRTIELSEDRDIIRWTERDHLTGLYNREYFYRYAAQYDIYHRDQPTDAIVLDINHFHMINDRYGKAYGDETLRRIGERARDVVKDAGGIVCRREADTFLVYCPHRSDYADILDHASVNLPGGGHTENRVRLRMGVYSNVDKTIDIERRFDRAKLAADTVKNSFTKAIAIYDDSLRESELFADQLIEDFPAAIREKQFFVVYQPKFDIRPNEPVLSSAEALVRWKHPRLGMVSPGAFIPVFEKNGLIQELDSYVWHETTAQVRDWKERMGVSVPVSVNVSRIDMYDPNFVEKMDALVRENGLEYKELLLEVTESAYTEDSSQIVEKVKQLREKGFRIEMDDFGSGYSSLNMISTLPIDALKLDMQFIRNAFKERKDTRLLEVVIQLAESLEVPTIAEGVETAEQMMTLKNMGCDIVQGYYFSRPLPADEFEVFVREKKEGKSERLQQGQKDRMDRMTYDALHDPLTGLYNQTAFEILFHDSDKDHLAVLIADIDGYDAIKETRGRAYADQTIRYVAGVLRANFRSADDICRIREDEFVIIMTRMTSAMRALVFDKVEKVNDVLRQPEGDQLPVSLSVGVAFSDRPNPEGDIFQDADKALYRMKEVRHCGCAVF